MNDIVLSKQLLSELTQINLIKFIKHLQITNKIVINSEDNFLTVYINLLKTVYNYLLKKQLFYKDSMRKKCLVSNNLSYVSKIIEIQCKRYREIYKIFAN